MRRKDREVTDRNQIKQILDEMKTCRLSMVDGGQPYVIPLSYGYTLENGLLTLYFHSAKAGRKIDVLKANSSVCVEVSTEGESGFGGETACEYVHYYKSIIGFGNAEFVEAYDEKNTALKLITKQQAGVQAEFTQKQTDTVCVFKVETKNFTAKKSLIS